MTTSVKVSLAMVGVVVLALAGLLIVNSYRGPDSTADEGSDVLQRDDSPVLSDGDNAVFVEFLDFECEGCLAAYPVIEDLRDRYGDDVTFVIRHMPLHGNSIGAARASEAAAEQGQFEAMYHKLFETVDVWGHQDSPQDEAFRGYAEELGLDMEQFEADFNDPQILERIEQSQADGRELGVTGTPTFFLDGELVEVSSVAELEAAVRDAAQG